MNEGVVRILLVEDNRSDAELVLHALRRGGLEVECERVDNLEALVEALERAPWDVVLSDYVLPGFNGIDAFKRVRELRPELPCLIISGQIGEETAVAAMRQGVDDYLLKDKLGRLPSAVERVLRQAELRRTADRAEQALLVGERRYRSIFNSAAVSLWELDLTGVRGWLDGHGIDTSEALSAAEARLPNLLVETASRAQVLAVNAATRRILGLSGEDVMVGPGISLVRVGLAPLWLCVVRAMVSGQPQVSEEASIQTPEGRLLRLALTADVPADIDELGNVVIVIHDLTDRFQLEQQMRAAQRMEAVGRLASGVAHDFNNILTVVQGYTELLRTQVEGNAVATDDLQAIDDAAGKAARLTTQLLAFGRRQIQQLARVDINACVTDLEGMLRRLIGADIELHTQLASDIGQIDADPVQIGQIIMNLAVNARDALPHGGKVTIETSNVELSEVQDQSRGDSVPPGRYAMLAVTDTGIGMDAATRERMFEPFFTTKPEGQGTGLGLSTVFGIVKQSHGHVWVYSEPGRGTTLKVYFPHRASSGVVAPDARPTQALSGGHETILLVEDEDMVRAATRRVLEQQGYRVVEAANGYEALRLARRHQGDIDLVLTDLVMPGMGGPELVRQLCAATTRVLYMSGYPDGALAHQGAVDPETPYLQKPFSPRQLLERVRDLLDGKSDQGTLEHAG